MEVVLLDAVERFILRRHHGLRQVLQQLEDGGAVAKVPARELARDMGMTEHLTVRERAHEIA